MNKHRKLNEYILIVNIDVTRIVYLVFYDFVVLDIK